MTFDPTVFVVDDDDDARDSLCALVGSLGVQTESFSSAEEFLACCTAGHSGCLVTDICMMGMSGLDLQDRLAELEIKLPVVILTAFPRTRSTVRAMAAGAVTLLEKPYAADELWDAIRKALARDAAARAETRRRCEIKERADLLTPDERTVMQMIVQGQPNKSIATQLNTSIRTIEGRRHKVFAKMGVESVATLVRLAIEGQLVE